MSSDGHGSTDPQFMSVEQMAAVCPKIAEVITQRAIETDNREMSSDQYLGYLGGAVAQLYEIVGALAAAVHGGRS